MTNFSDFYPQDLKFPAEMRTASLFMNELCNDVADHGSYFQVFELMIANSMA
jgi:hypothetical protein